MWDDRTDGMIVRDVGRASTMFQVLVHAKLSHDDVLRMHATDHHMGKKKAKCSPKHPCSVHDPDPFDVQVGAAASEEGRLRVRFADSPRHSLRCTVTRRQPSTRNPYRRTRHCDCRSKLRTQGGILTEGIVVQVRGTFGGDYGPETYNVGDIWGGRQI